HPPPPSLRSPAPPPYTPLTPRLLHPAAPPADALHPPPADTLPRSPDAALLHPSAASLLPPPAEGKEGGWGGRDGGTERIGRDGTGSGCDMEGGRKIR
ncbi:unnamed protein product, partial [Closterium sp. NIES-54]